MFQSHNTKVRSVAITSDSKYLISGGCDNTVRLWNIQDKTQEVVLEGHSKWITSVAITSNSKYIVSSWENMTVRIWNRHNIRAVLQAHS